MGARHLQDLWYILQRILVVLGSSLLLPLPSLASFSPPSFLTIPMSNFISPVLNPHLATHTDTRDSSYPPLRLTHSLSLLYSSGVLFSSFETGCHYVVKASLELVILLPQMRPQTWSQ